jgi:hypothetical protein
MIIPLPWQAIIPEWYFRDYRNAWIVKEYCSVFIGTGHSLWTITIIPLIKVYNIDSNSYGLEGHSIFKSVCNSEASWATPFDITYRQLQPKLFLPSGPSATKHGPNKGQGPPLIPPQAISWQLPPPPHAHSHSTSHNKHTLAQESFGRPSIVRPPVLSLFDRSSGRLIVRPIVHGSFDRSSVRSSK